MPARQGASVPAPFSNDAILGCRSGRGRPQFGMAFQEMTITSLLPRLRLPARLIVTDALTADRLVEARLMLAVRDSAVFPELPALAGWLQGLMERALHERGPG